MSGTRPKTFLAGAALVWRWQRLAWWILAVTLIFGFLSTQGMVDRASGTLNHSMASRRLVDGWDVSALIELLGQLQKFADRVSGTHGHPFLGRLRDLHAICHGRDSGDVCAR